MERSRPYLDLATEALRCLDSGNRVIERCVEYLSQLSLALGPLSKYSDELNIIEQMCREEAPS